MRTHRLPTYLLVTALLTGGSTIALTSCSTNEKKEVSQQGQQAYDKLESYVSEVETNPAAALPDTFATRLTAVQQYAAEYDTTRQAEIRRLEERYNQVQSASMAATATASTDTLARPIAAAETAVAPVRASEAPAKLYKASSPAAAMTAANARSTYEAFIQKVKANEDNYEIGDWRAVNADWRAMDKKYDQIKDDVSGKDKAEIAKEKLKYAAFKSFDKTESRVSQAGDVVSGDMDDAKAKGGGVRVGQTAKNVGSDAVGVAKDAKETGKDIGKGAVKVGKKVGGAVKGVFDGKDNKTE
ncbi:DUF6565 domain-containing protein [Hymenobacter sp. YC55]|uniref:DUF6565 domain-containing protein n=1 Tax=Hymenobacter sp. YC55 TaxID=3034019 RepID=UPI0023F86161|nr:DUF6565 domain-containing protein [Hymenobacter sp. YC55]MDF7815435.1 hypothetical protein [Hymenobacter sp. YC55]